MKEDVGDNRRQQPSEKLERHDAGEPIAVIGMACNFPGAPDLSSFWRLLESGGNAITKGVPGSGVGRIGEFYPESANQNPACRFAALVDDIDLFDAEFFRISPVEAQLLDPQQRMVLETCWKALEDALMDPERLRGSRTGVHVGISNNDYRTISLEASQPTEPATSLYAVAGTSFNTAAGRAAFALGLEGSAMAVDTACSSSLFALHQAVVSLQRKEADLFVVGGVQAIFLGKLTQLRANAQMLSPDGQCKAFDASANGFVRGEGCGMVVLKRLSDAQADGDRIWGVVLGSAVNQDGASAGLTVPSGTAQARVIEEALLQAGVDPQEVDYLEAHGTGTEVGDPIELNAATEIYGRGREPDRPLLVGSVKTNVGHLEPAAGVAGLMKVLLSMHRGVIPKHLHFNSPNPRIDWDNLPVKVTSEATAWPEVVGRPHRAGISSYGWSGTNVHVVVEAYANEKPTEVDRNGMPQPTSPTQAVSLQATEAEAATAAYGRQEARPARLLPLTGKSEAALKDLAKSYLLWLDDQTSATFKEGSAREPELSDMAWSASVARSHFDYRKGISFRDAQSLRESLRVVADGIDESPRQTASKVAFVYTGQGAQWVGMGAGLYESEPVFRAVLDRCDQLIQEERGVSLLDVMFGRHGVDGDLEEPQWTQPAIYALECALTALWRSSGIQPSAVLGHSLGEIAAAQAAGVFSLEDGLRAASARGRLLGALPQAGAMAAIFTPAPQVEEAVANWNAAHPGADLCIGVDNGTHQVVSGLAEEVHALADQLELAGMNVRRLKASPAYHSPLVEPALDDLEAAFSSLAISAPEIALVSNLTGAPIKPDASLDGAYWRQHARQPVAFRAGVESLAAMGVDAVIELGPHSVLGPLVSLNWPDAGLSVPVPVVLQSVRRPSWDGSEPERVSNTAVFDYPNVTALASHLAEEIAQSRVNGPTIPVAESVSPTLRRASSADEEGIAIVGIACRFPSAPDLESFWKLLESGTDAVTDGRQDAGPWHGVTGDPTSDNPLYRRGGFVEGIDRFDNSFFRISPIEARMMDPAQRMLLETTWQALEDAGIDPGSLKKSRTGVYAGIGSSEYRDVIAASGQDDLYFGTSGSITAGRVAFVLGLEGPAMPVDMACSSSLAAIHQAVTALQRGEVDMALASGTNITLSQSIVRFHRDMGMLSTSGQCNAFDASADGFVRSEGCGVLVLKRLSEAQTDGDRIWGLVLGTAINQNGASAGLPVPNGPAQERVMEDALARAGVDPSKIDYLEAHGTGTDLGDSIELRALASVYRRGRESERPLLVGSVKTNIGHAEWAAGMASVIKSLLAMHKGVIPAHLHFKEPNPNFDWGQMPVTITSKQTPWPLRDGGQPLSAVNSFGLSGTNAHVVLEGYGGNAGRNVSWPYGPEQTVAAAMPPDISCAEVADGEGTERSMRVLPLSARSPEALTALAGEYAAWLDQLEASTSSAREVDRILADAAWTAGTGRSHFKYRAGLTFRNVAELREGLDRLTASGVSPGQEGLRHTARTAFVYMGHGQHWTDTAEVLYWTEPVVRAALDRCDGLVREECGKSLLNAIFAKDGAGDGIEDPPMARAAHFSMQAALTTLWQSVGVLPSAVLGKGIGELAAAYGAGILSVADGLRVALALSGPDASLPLITVNQPRGTMFSSLTGRAVQSSDELYNVHWQKLAGEVTGFPTCVRALAGTGVDLVVVVGKEMDAPPLEHQWPRERQTESSVKLVEGTGWPTDKAPGGGAGFAAEVAQAYEVGASIAFAGLFLGESRRKVSLPGYPFQRRSFWVQSPKP